MKTNEEIAAEWANTAYNHCEDIGGFDSFDEAVPFFLGAINEATAQLAGQINPEIHGATIEECQFIARHYRNRCIDLERSQLAPQWTTELPKDEGEYLWTDDSGAYHAFYVFKNFSRFYIDHNDELSTVEQMKGHWLRIVPPKPPK